MQFKPTSSFSPSASIPLVFVSQNVECGSVARSIIDILYKVSYCNKAYITIYYRRMRTKSLQRIIGGQYYSLPNASVKKTFS